MAEFSYAPPGAISGKECPPLAPVTIRPRKPDDDQQIVDIGNRIYPQFPEESVAEFRHWMKSRPATARHFRWVAEANGRILGHAVLSERWGTGRKDVYYAFIGIEPGNERQGIGSRLYEVLLEKATEVRAERVYAEVQEGHDQAEAFATRRGFAFTGQAEQMSRLEVQAANLEGYEGVAERLQEAGIRILTLAEAGADDERVLHGLHEVDTESAKDVPSSEPFVGAPYDIWLEHIRGPGSSPEHLWIAMDGDRPVGMAQLDLRGTRAAFNGYTGVLRAYRGRGVARGLKLKTVEWARENGIDYIYTGNNVNNQRMLAINIRLGYKPLPKFREVLKEPIP